VGVSLTCLARSQLSSELSIPARALVSEHLSTPRLPSQVQSQSGHQRILSPSQLPHSSPASTPQNTPILAPHTSAFIEL